jgi:hypothetical protein
MLPLTPQALKGAYDFLRSTAPFCRWDLSPGEAVEFKILRTPHFEGDHWVKTPNGKHIIRVSSRTIGHTMSLIVVMAHEMLHAVQTIKKTETPGAQHNADFHRRAAQVCNYHGFDLKTFVR